MKVEKYIRQIVEAENNEEMEALEEVFYKTLRYLQDACPKMYDEVYMDIYIIANGECITKEDAMDYVEDMMPYGEHWTYEQTTQVGRQSGIGFDKFSEPSFYWTMNMLYNDYSEVLGGEASMYIKLAKAFLLDEDAPSGDAKVFRYINAMKN